MLTKSARLVLLAIQQETDHSYTALQTSAGVARATLASALQELTAAGLITAVKAFGKSTRYTISQAAGSLTAHSSSSSVVQKFNSSIVQPIALHDDESLSKENISSSCNAKTSELLNQRPDFRAQVFTLLGEWKLAGRKREQLADAIANLPNAPESILSDIKKARDGAVKRATINPAGLTVHLLTEYAATGQITLFDLPTPAPRKQGRGVQRRPQVQYADDSERAKAAERNAAREIEEREARRIQSQRDSENLKRSTSAATFSPSSFALQPSALNAWDSVKEVMERETGRGNFITFLKAAQLAAVDGDRALIVCPNKYGADWLANRSADRLAALWQTHTGAFIRFTFAVKQPEAAHV